MYNEVFQNSEVQPYYDGAQSISLGSLEFIVVNVSYIETWFNMTIEYNRTAPVVSTVDSYATIRLETIKKNIELSSSSCTNVLTQQVVFMTDGMNLT